MHSTLQSYCSKRKKLIYRTTRIILPRQLTPICPFICGKPIEFATFSRTVVITPVNNTKHQFPFHRKFMKHRVKPVLLKAVRSSPEPSGRNRPEPSGAVRTTPGAVPTPPVIQLLNVQKEINRTQITCSLLAQYLHFVMYKMNMEKMRKIMSLHVMQKLIRL